MSHLVRGTRLSTTDKNGKSSLSSPSTSRGCAISTSSSDTFRTKAKKCFVCGKPPTTEFSQPLKQCGSCRRRYHSDCDYPCTSEIEDRRVQQSPWNCNRCRRKNQEVPKGRQDRILSPSQDNLPQNIIILSDEDERPVKRYKSNNIPTIGVDNTTPHGLTPSQNSLEALIANASNDLRLKYLVKAVATDQASQSEKMEFENYVNGIGKTPNRNDLMCSTLDNMSSNFLPVTNSNGGAAGTSAVEEIIIPESPVANTSQSTEDVKQDGAEPSYMDAGGSICEEYEPETIWHRENSPLQPENGKCNRISSGVETPPPTQPQAQLDRLSTTKNPRQDDKLHHLEKHLSTITSSASRTGKTLLAKPFPSIEPSDPFEKELKLKFQLTFRPASSLDRSVTKRKSRDVNISNTDNDPTRVRTKAMRKPKKSSERNHSRAQRETHVQLLEAAISQSSTENDRLCREVSLQKSLLESTTAQLREATRELNAIKQEKASQPTNDQEVELLNLRSKLATFEKRLARKEITKSERRYVHYDLYSAAPEMFPGTVTLNAEGTKPPTKDRPLRKQTFGSVSANSRVDRGLYPHREKTRQPPDRLRSMRKPRVYIPPLKIRPCYDTDGSYSVGDSMFSVQSTSEEERRRAAKRHRTPDNQRSLENFDKMIGIPKNPIPCLTNMQLGYRDGTRDQNGRLPRARGVFKVGRHVAGQLR